MNYHQPLVTEVKKVKIAGRYAARQIFSNRFVVGVEVIDEGCAGCETCEKRRKDMNEVLEKGKVEHIWSGCWVILPRVGDPLKQLHRELGLDVTIVDPVV